ncbi:YiiX/YebB-like N1pC/P60 family cysteine hydrolase, partial [Vibrio parahaemolyticus]
LNRALYLLKLNPYGNIPFYQIEREMTRKSIEAGDVIVTSGNIFLWVATGSKWSHVAMAINSHEVIEAIPEEGVTIRTIKNCVSGSKEAYVYQRPQSQENYEKKLQESIGDFLGKKYNYRRALYSGITNPIRNVSIFTILLSMVGYYLSSVYLPELTYDVPLLGYYLLTEIFLTIIILSIVVTIPMAYLAGMSQFFYKVSTKLGLPKLLVNNMTDQFCSQLVEELDDKIGGELSFKKRRFFESRPKDIVKILDALGWEKVKIYDVKQDNKKSVLVQR